MIIKSDRKMARLSGYIKVRPQTAAMLGLDLRALGRPRLPDGNEFITITDSTLVAPVKHFSRIPAMIGGVLLSAEELRMEMEGGPAAELPWPQDERYTEGLEKTEEQEGGRP